MSRFGIFTPSNDLFAAVFDAPGPWHRVLGIRANASSMSHEELDDSTELDSGEENDLAARYANLAGRPLISRRVRSTSQVWTSPRVLVRRRSRRSRSMPSRVDGRLPSVRLRLR